MSCKVKKRIEVSLQPATMQLVLLSQLQHTSPCNRDPPQPKSSIPPWPLPPPLPHAPTTSTQCHILPLCTHPPLDRPPLPHTPTTRPFQHRSPFYPPWILPVSRQQQPMIGLQSRCPSLVYCLLSVTEITPPPSINGAGHI